MKKQLVLLFVVLGCCGAALEAAGQSVVTRTTKAVSYRRAGESTKIDFHGTELMQRASGEARVENKKTRVEIDAHFDGLLDSTQFGLEYLTYVLWAVSTQGRAENLGELLVKNGSARLKGATTMQTFGMIVTAEPYFAVNQPSNVVVLENVLRTDTLGKEETIEAKYELLGRGVYSSSNTKIENAIFGIDPKTPRELFEARNAVRIAHIAQGDKYAASSVVKAEQQLRQAEELYRLKRDKSSVEAAAREVVQTAEEARVMSVKLKGEEEAQARIAAEKRAAEAREAKARADADAEIQRRKDAELARAQAQAAQASAEKMRMEAEKAAAEAARQKQEADTARAALAVEADKSRQLAQQAEQARQQADLARQQAEKEKLDLRARLLQQLNSILATRDTARGLIANLSDVLFKTGSAELLPGARERLAKVSGIVLAYPGLHLDVEGHTDSVGGDEYNQGLSERRAAAVRDYLVQQGIAGGSIASRGLGKTQPVATNDTAEGRQQNRRVELVLSGDAIGNSTAEKQ
ncbi:MAG TPA: OmpA family protein [Candidatus Saccharimonadales bacterium]|jgi:outer membrane protein OmpA-like peptidoglycan-associated protein|nr:OmpA family protein [Candidatus Saccharimonadales bacterium]